MTAGVFEVLSPVTYLFVPVAIMTAFRRRWTFALFVFLVPTYGLKLFSLVGHPVTPPEFLVLLLCVQQVGRWIADSRIELRSHRQVLLLFGFGAACSLSVLYAVLSSPSVAVYPYTRPFGHIGETLIPYQLTGKAVSQLLLRMLFVAAVFVLTVTLDRELIRRSMRWLLFAGVLTGLVGVSYQLSTLVGVSDVFRAVVHDGLGFVGFVTPPKSYGPVPRMYSLSGEPGFTADFLLYALSLAVSLLFAARNRVLLSPALTYVSLFLFGVLLLTTGATGYGGLLILAGVLVVTIVACDGFGPGNVSPGDRVRLSLVAILTAPVVLYFAPDLLSLVGRTGSKILLQSGSGQIRLVHIQQSIGVFRARPVLGAGVGSHHSPSLLPTILAETGLVGASLFVGFGGSVFAGSLGVARRFEADRDLALPLFVSGATLFLTNLFAKGLVSLLFPWFWISLALPIALINHSGSDGDRV